MKLYVKYIWLAAKIIMFDEAQTLIPIEGWTCLEANDRDSKALSALF